MGQSLPGSAESPQRCRNHLAQLCLRFAPFPTLVGGGASHHRHYRKSPHRFRLTRLYPLPDQSAASTRRRQYQSPSGHCRTRFTADFPGCPASLRSRLSVRLLASAPAQRRTFSSRLEPLARADAQARDRAPIQRGGGAVLGGLPHLARLGHGGPDAVRWPAFLRSARAQPRASAAVGSATARPRQGWETALCAFGSRNPATAGSLPALGAALSLWCTFVRKSQRPRQ